MLIETPRHRSAAWSAPAKCAGLLLPALIAGCGPAPRQIPRAGEAELARQARAEDSVRARRPPVHTPCSAEQLAALTTPRQALHATLTAMDGAGELPIEMRAAMVESIGRRRLKFGTVSDRFAAEIWFTWLANGAVDSVRLLSNSGREKLDQDLVRALLSAAYTRSLPEPPGDTPTSGRRLLLRVLPGRAPVGAWPFPHPSTVAPDTADMPAILAPGNSPLRYPPHLRNRGIGGEVEVAVMVDATGAPIPSTTTLVRATHDEFLDVVLNSLPRVRFLPAVAGECTVPAWVEQPFQFRVMR